MNAVFAGSPTERTIWIFVVFVLYLYWNRVELSEAFWLVLGGLVTAWITGALLAIPVSIHPGYSSYEHAFRTVTPWLVLIIVPIYVWRRLPSVLIPRVKLSELLFWNVLVTALAFGTAGARLAADPASAPFWDFLGLRAGLFLLGLWPTALALFLRSRRDPGTSFLRHPLLLYYWISLVWWLGSAVLDAADPWSWPIFGLLSRVWVSFAAIQCFAVLYLAYYAVWGHGDLDFQTARRVGAAVEGALGIDEWRRVEALALAFVLAAGGVAFAWWNQSAGWEIPLYSVLALPKIFSEALASVEAPEPVH